MSSGSTGAGAAKSSSRRAAAASRATQKFESSPVDDGRPAAAPGRRRKISELADVDKFFKLSRSFADFVEYSGCEGARPGVARLLQYLHSLDSLECPSSYSVAYDGTETSTRLVEGVNCFRPDGSADTTGDGGSSVVLDDDICICIAPVVTAAALTATTRVKHAAQQPNAKQCEPCCTVTPALTASLACGKDHPICCVEAPEQSALEEACLGGPANPPTAFPSPGSAGNPSGEGTANSNSPCGADVTLPQGIAPADTAQSSPCLHSGSPSSRVQPKCDRSNRAGNKLLNVGCYVWALDFSPPVVLHESTSVSSRLSPPGGWRDETSKGAAVEPAPPAAVVSVLAIGAAPFERPVSRTLGHGVQRQSGPGVLQLWRVPVYSGSSGHPSETTDAVLVPQLRVAIHHKGVYCRSLAWARYSQLSSHSEDLTQTRAGLLFTVYGDGSVNCYSVPALPFMLHAPATAHSNGSKHSLLPSLIWRLHAGVATCIAVSPFFVTTSSDAVTVASRPAGAAMLSPAVYIRVAIGLQNGCVAIWDICAPAEKESEVQPRTAICPTWPYQIIEIEPMNSISSLSWSPAPQSTLLAVGTNFGKCIIWDVSRPLDGFLRQFEISRRPMYSTCWSPIVRFILACHECGLIYNIVTREANRRLPFTSAGSGPRDFATERPAWGCCALGPWSFFVFDQGRLLASPAVRTEKRHNNALVLLSWNLTTTTEDPAAGADDGALLDQRELPWKASTTALAREATLVSAAKCGRTPFSTEAAATGPPPSAGLELPAESSLSATAADSASSIAHMDPQLLEKFYAGAATLYGKSVLLARSCGITIQYGGFAEFQRSHRSQPQQEQQGGNADRLLLQKSKSPQKQHSLSSCLDSNARDLRLQAVCSLDRSVYPMCPTNLVAYGGSAGVVHIFEPHLLGIN